MENTPRRLRAAEHVYRDILSRGVILTQCGCHIDDTNGSYKGYSSSDLDILSYKTGIEWQALVWYRFVSSVHKFSNDTNFSLSTNSRFALSIFDREIDEKDVVEATADLLGDWGKAFKCGPQQLRCSVTFASGTTLEDVQPYHPAILPVLSSAHANLGAEFFAQEKKLAETVEPRYRQHVGEALDSLLKRYSAFVAQTTRQHFRQLFGVK